MDCKNIWSKTREILGKTFKWLFNDWKNLAVVVLGIAAIWFFLGYRSAKNDLINIVKEKNTEITVYKNKVGELYSQVETYVTDIKHLEESNSELYSEVQRLKDNPIVITKFKTVTEYKDIYITDTAYVVQEGVYKSRISYSDQWTSINGSHTLNTNTMLSETLFDSILFMNDFTLDLIESRKGDLSFIVRSNNPYCQINSIDGVMLSPEDCKAVKARYDKKWCLVVGVGPSFTIVDNKFAVLPSLNITVGRKIFGF